MHALRTLTVLVATLAFGGLAAAQTANKSSKKKSAAPAPVVQEVAAPLPTADSEQLMAAALTMFGAYQCEYNQTLTVNRHPTAEGYIVVAQGQRSYMMKPVRSMTGALRLEEVSGAMLMVQIPSKSMLMDTKLGKRVVDACKNDEQLKEVETADSLGISAPGQMVINGSATASAQPRR